MDASVVIPSYRAERTIEKCLQNILSQTTSGRYEVIVCDSSPGAEVQNIAAQYPVRFIKKTKKIPPGIARNIGAESAQGELLIFIDADIILSPGALEEIWKCYRQGRDVFSIALELDKESKSLSSRVEQYLFFCEYQSGRKSSERKNLPSTVFVIKKELFSSFGGFKSYWRGEDTEFTERISKAGKQPMFIPWIVAYRGQNIPLMEIAGKNFKNGLFWERRHFPKATRSKKMIVLFLTPFLSLLKSTRIVCRNTIYNHGADKGLSLLLSPLLFLLGFWWSAGIFAGLFSNTNDEEELSDSCRYI